MRNGLKKSKLLKLKGLKIIVPMMCLLFIYIFLCLLCTYTYFCGHCDKISFRPEMLSPAPFPYFWNSPCSFLLLFFLYSTILMHNAIFLYFVQNATWHSISYTLCEFLLYTLPHVVLKCSSKGEDFYPSHVLKIKTF